MEIILNHRQMDEIAYKTALILEKRLQKNRLPDLVSTSEAARILRITPGRLRQIVCNDPNRYPHIKTGDTKQAKLLFDRNALIQ